MNETVKSLFKQSITNMPGGPRLYMKRLGFDGYEPDWVDISQYVKKFPKVKRDFGDEQHLGRFKTQRSSITLINNNAQFSDESNPKSLFTGFVDRIRTKIKLEMVLTDSDGNEHLVDRVYWYVYGDIKEGSGTVTFPLRDLLHALKNESCSGVTFTQGMSLSDMIGALLKKEHYGGRIFDSFVEGQTDAERYVLPTSNYIPSNIADYQAILTPDKSIFDIISRYCLFLNGFLFVNQSGNFELNINRNVANDVMWEFNYLSSYSEYGSNVVKLAINNGIKDIYNSIYIRYGEDDADLFAKVIDYNPNTWQQAESTKLYFLFGEKKYSETFHELGLNTSSIDPSTTEVEELATRLFDYYSQQKKMFTIQHAPCILKPLDKVLLNAEGRDLLGDGQSPFRLGVSQLGGGDVLTSKAGSITYIALPLKVISSEYDPNTMKFKTKLKEFGAIEIQTQSYE